MKKTIIYLIIMLLATISFSSFSGNKCKFKSDKKDAFTGKSVRYSNVAFSSSHSMPTTGEITGAGFQLGDEGGQFYITFEILFCGELDDVIKAGDTTVIKLENGDFIYLTSNKNATPNSFASGGVVYTKYTSRFNVENSVMKKISESPITAIRCSIQDRNFTIEPNSGNPQKIMNIASCLLSAREEDSH